MATEQATSSCGKKKRHPTDRITTLINELDQTTIPSKLPSDFTIRAIYITNGPQEKLKE